MLIHQKVYGKFTTGVEIPHVPVNIFNLPVPFGIDTLLLKPMVTWGSRMPITCWLTRWDVTPHPLPIGSHLNNIVIFKVPHPTPSSPKNMRLPSTDLLHSYWTWPSMWVFWLNIVILHSYVNVYQRLYVYMSKPWYSLHATIAGSWGCCSHKHHPIPGVSKWHRGLLPGHKKAANSNIHHNLSTWIEIWLSRLWATDRN